MGEIIKKSGLASVVLLTIFGTTFVFHITQSFQINFAKAEKFLQRDQYMMSLGYLIPAASAKPQNKEVLKDLAIVYDKLGRKEDCLFSLEILESIEIKDLEIKKWLADAYYGNNDFAVAERLYRDILTEKKSPAVKRKLAEVSAWQGKYSRAEILLNQLCLNSPSDYKTRELLADIYTWDKKYNQAAELYSQVISSDGRNYDVILKLADVLRYSGKDRQSLKLYKQYIEKTE